MNRVPVTGRRVWKSFGDYASCLVFGLSTGDGRWKQWDFSHAFSAYEMNLYRRGEVRGEAGRRATAVAESMTSPIAYAFYARESEQVKIGRTTNLLARWTKLENESGSHRQLLAVWRGVNAVLVERQLHDRWLAHRAIGEWFQADPVVADLAEMKSMTQQVGAQGRS